MRALSEFIHFLVINDLLLRRSSIDIRSAPLRLIFYQVDQVLLISKVRKQVLL
jgi:hypothetical protein